MLFNTFVFIFVFLPIVLTGFYGFGSKIRSSYVVFWLFLCSLFFYGWWKPSYLILIAISIIVNFFVSRQIAGGKKRFLYVGVSFNLMLLFFYKYVDFFISNLNIISNQSIPFLDWALPIGISFYTFQQIAYLIDCKQGTVVKTNFFSYGLFVTFFPQLIAGPIVHHKEMISQFDNPIVTKINYFNISRGIFIFLMGLSKKIILADSFGIIADNGFANILLLSTKDAWLTSLAYSMQLYYDFSGYSSMAIGLGLLFNIRLPQNFNSPYRSINIQEFWRNWHITLSRFLRDYVYIPLGGSRISSGRTNFNLILTFFLGGIWHGAGWTFIVWGLLHGIALVLHRYWKYLKVDIPIFLSILITFLFVNITWVFFRANNIEEALGLLFTMFRFSEGTPSNYFLFSNLYDLPIWSVGVILLFLPNDSWLGTNMKPNLKYGIMTVFLFIINMIYLNSVIQSDFLYFDF